MKHFYKILKRDTDAVKAAKNAYNWRSICNERRAWTVNWASVDGVRGQAIIPSSTYDDAISIVAGRLIEDGIDVRRDSMNAY